MAERPGQYNSRYNWRDFMYHHSVGQLSKYNYGIAAMLDSLNYCSISKDNLKNIKCIVSDVIDGAYECNKLPLHPTK